ncbi:MAG: glutathione S-transferase family protein [Betaproteobacteria bacterium]|nr:glutathione S-transferase family protein [Betaproteobacteria bacterium]
MALKMFDLAGAHERHRFSPYCWRVRLACAHKGLALDTVPWRFADKAQLPTPNEGTVPLLVDDDRIVSDSWKIAEYLDARYPRMPLFEGTQAKSQALFIKFWSERALHPLISSMVLKDVWLGLHEKDKDYFRVSREKRFGKTLEEIEANREETRVRFSQAIDPLRATLTSQTFLSGTAPGHADHIVFGTFMWARCTSNFEVLEESDPVWVWREKMLGLHDGLALKAQRNTAPAQ